AMQSEMVDRAADAGVRRVVFKPHPSAPPALNEALARRAAQRGVSFAVYAGDQPAEYVARRLEATDVVPGFSTALPTVRALSGTRTHAVGTGLVLARLLPYQNSNRMPATIVDAMARGRHEQPDRLQQLVDAVGYAMQPDILAPLRAPATRFLSELDAVERERYVLASRLSALDLPGAPAPSRVRRALASTGGVGRIEELRLTAAGARNRAARVWKAASGR